MTGMPPSPLIAIGDEVEDKCILAGFPLTIICIISDTEYSSIEVKNDRDKLDSVADFVDSMSAISRGKPTSFLIHARR